MTKIMCWSWWWVVVLVLVLPGCGGDEEHSPAQVTQPATETVDTLPGNPLPENPPALSDSPQPGPEMDSPVPVVAGLMIADTLYGAGIVRSPEVRFTGYGPRKRPIELALNGRFVGSAMAREDGTWELDYRAIPLPEGEHELQVTAVDALGERTDADAPFRFAYVPDAMEAPVITGITPDTGASDSDGITAATNLSVQGTATPNLPVEITLDGTVAGTVTANANGDWQLDYSQVTLADGTYQLAAETVYEDLRSAVSPLFTLVVDTQAQLPTLALLTSTGSDTLTNLPGLIIGGTAEPGSEVEVWLDGEALGSTTADAAGNWELDDSATQRNDGDYSLSASITDLAGNESEVTTPLIITIDTQAPPVPVVTGISDDTGISASDGITRDNQLTFAGTAAADTQVRVLLDGTEVGTTTSNSSGNWAFDYATPLSDGSYQISAIARDLAGNDSAASAGFTVTVDTTAPTLNSTLPAPDATGVGLVTPLSLTFSQPVWVQSGNLSIHRSSDDSLVGSIAMDSSAVTGNGSNTLTVTPASPWAGSTSYYLLLDADSVTDTAGNGFAGISDSSQWRFSTQATTLVALSPANNATDVPSGASLTLQFNEPVTSGSGNLSIRRLGDGSLFQSVAVTDSNASWSGQSLTVTPPTVLAAATEFYVELDAGAVVNSEGAPFVGFAGNDRWRFTTAEGAVVTIDNVTSPAADGSYNTGDLIPIQLVFSEAVTVDGGVPRLRLALDDGPRLVDYVSGSGSDTLVFDYRVALGDSSPALDVADVDALLLDGATLRSATLVDADVRLPLPGSAGSLSDNKNLVIAGQGLNGSDLGDNGYHLVGTLAGGALGSSLTPVGDINGSGFEDFAVGAPGADSDRGLVYVIYGNGATTPPTVTLDANGAIDPAQGFRILGAALGDRAGEAVGGAGDFNGDGIDDLYVTAPGSAMGGNQRGGVYIIWGQPSATRGDVDLATFATGPTASNSGGLVIPGREDGQRLGEGSHLAPFNGQVIASGGDFNGDGVMDLALGHPGSDRSATDAGQAYVLFGQRGASRSNIDLLALGKNGRRIDPGNLPGAAFGQGVSFIGDFNGNGHDDLALGAPGDSTAAGNAGRAHVFFGRPGEGLLTTAGLDGQNGFTLSTLQNQALLGHALAGGDFNGNGRADLAIGAPGLSRAWVIYGVASGSYSPVLVDSLSASAGYAILSETGSDALGHALSSAGDFNGNGIDDLLLGAYNSDAGGTAAGAAWVILGQTGNPASLNLASLPMNRGLRIGGGSSGDRLGLALGSGDMNGDGFSDVLLGAPGSGSGGQMAVLLGRDYASQILPGSTGTSAPENLVGSAGDDSLSGGGGADALSSGAGNDLLGVGDLSFRKIRGGRGSALASLDALLLETSGSSLDLLGLAPETISNIELIDLGDMGNSLNLDPLRLLRLSRTTPRLVVTGGGSDSVSVAPGDFWVNPGSEDIAGTSYSRYLSGGAELLVQAGLNQDGISTLDGQQRFHIDTTPPSLFAAPVISNPVTDFPLLLRITDSTIIQAVEPGAPDIRLLDADGVTLLDYEVARWDQSANQGEIWVRVPLIHGNTNGASASSCQSAGVSSGQCNTVTLVYGGSGLSDGQNAPGVWNDYAGVWHLNETASGAHAQDSSGFGNTAILTNGLGENVAAVTGRGRRFTQSNAMVVPFHEPSMSVADNRPFTVSAWIRQRAAGSACFGQSSEPMIQRGTSGGRWRLMSIAQTLFICNNTAERFILSNGTVLGGGGDGWAGNDPGWVLFHAVYNGASTRFYKNGSLVASNTGVVNMENGQPLVFGETNMIFDEVRLGRLAMTPEEVRLTYANQRPDSSLVTPAP